MAVGAVCFCGFSSKCCSLRLWPRTPPPLWHCSVTRHGRPYSIQGEGRCLCRGGASVPPSESLFNECARSRGSSQACCCGWSAVCVCCMQSLVVYFTLRNDYDLACTRTRGGRHRGRAHAHGAALPRRKGGASPDPSRGGTRAAHLDSQLPVQLQRQGDARGVAGQGGWLQQLCPSHLLTLRPR